MIKEKEIMVNITRRNITYYKNLGYKTDKINTEISIKIEDVNKNSHDKITAICEKCGKETSIRIEKYYVNKDRCGYYGCRDCSRIKYKETCIDKFGFDNPMKSEEIKLLVENNNIEKYGVKTTLLEYNTKEKIKKTNLEKYGCEEVLSSPIIREKSKITFLEKYGVDSYSKTKSFYDDTYRRWEKDSLEKLNRYNITKFKLLENRTIDIWCNKCNDYYNITPKNLYQRTEIQKGVICTKCNSLKTFISGKEIELLQFIEENYDGEILTSNKKIIKPYELDIYLPELNLAFEFNGIYWHSDLYKQKNYHIDKSNMCHEENIKLVHIWEDDWLNKKDIIKSMILNRLNKTENKLFARKCNIKEVDNDLVRIFLYENHIQGFVGSNIKLGLFYDNELVSLMTFGKKRINMGEKHKDGSFEMMRFCNKLNMNVIGGANKLFKYFILNYKINDILSFSDISYFDGKLYEKLGFELEKITEPNYSYYDKQLNKYNRYNFRKDVLVSKGYDKSKTEFEIMDELGYLRVYNCGNYKYVYRLDQI